MIPSAFVALDSFPLLPNGKIDRRALPLPGTARPELEQTFVAPRDPLEEQIASIWREVLNLEQVGIHDNFFDLGGHSLHAMQVLSRLSEPLQIDVPVSTLFDTPTIASFAGLLTAVRRQRKSHSGPILRAARDRPAPLSFAQQRLWFLHQIEPRSPAYNLPHSIRMHGSLSVPALESAFQTVMARHEALRTRLVVLDGEPTQQVAPAAEFQLPLVDLSQWTTEQRDTELARLRAEEPGKPFTLGRDLPLRAKLIRLSPEAHELLVTLHHVACDGWSVEILWDELFAAYEAKVSGKPFARPDLSIQYTDFTQWQRSSITGPVLAEQLSYWKQQLAGAPALLELPTDHPRPQVQSDRGRRHPIRFSAELSNALRDLSHEQNCTLFMTILAGFNALLARYTGRDDIVVGTAIANRTRSELERLIGFFANTLVLRADLSGDPSFREALERTRTVTLEAYAHQDLPFERLVEELQPHRDRSYNPLFQVMLVLENVPTATRRLGNLEITVSEVDPQTALFDLTVHLAQNGDHIEGYIRYSTDLFESETIDRMARHLQSLLENAVAKPDVPLSRLNLLDESEREQLLVQWNQTGSPYPKELTFVQLFEAQVQRSSETIALVVGQQQLSYAELNARTNQLAHRLRSLGIGPESLVGICCERNLDMLVGMLAVLKAGGAYLPMDPNYPAERLAFMLQDAKAPLLLTQEKFKDRFAANTKVLCLDTLDVSSESTANPPAVSRPNNLAYVIYTSGSTGQPKGVALEHRSLNAFAHWAREQFSAEELDGVLAGTSICFDLSVFELLVPLCWGGKVILAQNVLELPELPAAAQVRLINTVPSAAAELLHINGIPSGVQVVNLAGEPLRQSLVDQLYQLGTVTKVYDLYGPTEDTVYSTCALRRPKGRVTIGRPLANKQAYILDEQMEPVPVGVAGQLYIGGDGLARGYLHRPELTSERFIEHNGQRLYKTGDLARYQPDGNIEFLGRADHQVKIRGFRIELGEIEAQLRQHPGVRDGIVVAREHNGEKRLVAYVVASPEITVSDLRDYFKKRLPDYMVPGIIMLLPELPRTANGKIDRKSLPAPDATALQAEQFVPPETEIETLLAKIWCEILGLQSVGIHDNFFQLGGHSLMITRLISRVREAIQVELPMASVFEAPTIAELALMLEDILIREIDELAESEADPVDDTILEARAS